MGRQNAPLHSLTPNGGFTYCSWLLYLPDSEASRTEAFQRFCSFQHRTPSLFYKHMCCFIEGQSGRPFPNAVYLIYPCAQEDVAAALQLFDQRFCELEAVLSQDNSTPMSSEQIIREVELLSETLLPWGTMSHLNGVCNNSELRDAVAAVQPLVVTASSRLLQSKVLNALQFIWCC